MWQIFSTSTMSCSWRSEQEHAKNSVWFGFGFVTAVYVDFRKFVDSRLVKRDNFVDFQGFSGQSKQQQDSEGYKGKA